MTRRPKRVDDDTYAEVSQEVLDIIAEDYPEDLDAIVGFLSGMARGKQALLDLMKFKHRPVPIREFIESKSFMNKAGVIWPEVMLALEAINDGSRTECVLTGAIGVAKSTIALYTQAYQLYTLSCLRRPHEEFDLDPSSEITIVFQSLNEKLAKAVDYARFRDMISKAPYFKQHFRFDTGIESEMRFPNRIIVKPVSGQDTAALGQNVIGALIDEVNFMSVVQDSKVNHDGAVYDQAVQNYNSIARRRESRFMNRGWLPGMLCIVSSRNYPGQFTDILEAQARTNPRIYVYDKRLWQIRPDRFCGETFRVFIGDEARKPRILEDEEAMPMEDDPLVMAIPIENRGSFDADILKALRDVAGVATQALHPFMVNVEAVVKSFGKIQSIASREDCDFKTTRIELYPKRVLNPYEPRWAHVDLAFSKDSAGVVVGHVPGFEHVMRGPNIETLPKIVLDLLLEVKPPRNGEIEFENIRQLLYTLRDKMKLPIKWVTFDTFQSKDSMQLLHTAGFITGIRSMDTDTLAYDITKQAFYDGRVSAPFHPKAMKELCRLEIDTKKQKIDHPPNGSKDVADSIAGVICGLTRAREVWIRHKIPLHRIPATVMAPKPKEEAKPDNRSYIARMREKRGLAPRDVDEEAS